MSDSRSGGASALTILGVVFVALKLAKVITWSWWWVTAPFWGPLALFLVVVVFAALGAFAARSGKRQGTRRT